MRGRDEMGGKRGARAGGSRVSFAIGLLCLMSLVPCTGWAAFSFVRASSPVLYIDTPKTLFGMYAAYRVNSTTAIPDVWVKITGFSGGVVTAAGNEDGVFHIGAMGANTTKTAFFYLVASAETTVAQTHRLEVYDRNPQFSGATLLATSADFSLTAAETIAANANKVTTVVTGPNPATLGGIVTITVTGETGTVGGTGTLAFTPATYTAWPANKYEMISSQITLPNGAVLTDNLYMTGYSGAAGTHTEVYRFAATGTTATPSAVSPTGYISSGSPIKHTDTGGFASLSPIPPASNTLSMGLLANGVSPADISPAGGTVTYTVRLTNSGANDATMDDFVDTLASTPAPVGYVPGSSRFNGAAIPDPGISGQVLTWNGTFLVPANSTRDLTFQVAFPGTPGTYANSVVGHIQQEQIDTTLTTADNAPATCTVEVLRRPTVTKSFSPAAMPPNGTSRLTLTIGNANRIALTTVSLADNLPVSPGAMRVAAVPNASNGCGGTLTAVAGSDNVRLAGATVADNTSCSIAVDVTASDAGTYSNASGGVVSAETGTTGEASNTATLQVVLNPTASLSFSPGEMPVSDNTLLTVVIANPDPGTSLHDLSFTLGYPATVVNAASPGGATTCVGGVVTAAPSGGSLALSGGTLAPSDNCTVTVRITDTAPGDRTLTLAAGGLSSAEGRANLAPASAVLHVLSPPTVTTGFSPAGIGTNGVSRLSVTLLNSNTVAISGVSFEDAYPAGLVNATPSGVAGTCGSPTLTAAPGGTGLTVSGASIPPSGSCEITVNVTSPSAGSYVNGIPLVTTANAGTAASDNAVLTVTSGVAVSGHAYSDSNHNGSRDAGEGGTGAGRYVKLATRNGAGCDAPALQVANVDAATGAFAFSEVVDGDYCLVLSTVDDSSDVSPVPPSGWLPVETPDGIRTATVAGSPVSGADFGLFNGIRISGRAFSDTGAGGGTANNGIQDGGEAGLGGVSIRVADNAGSVTYDAARSGGSGEYALWIPASAGASQVAVIESRPDGSVSTGGSAGTTGGTYERATGTVRFTLTQGSGYSGVNFGGVGQSRLMTDGAKTALAGSIVFHPHTFAAGTEGTLTLSTAATPAPALAGWSESLFRDVNCNGSFDSGETPVSGPFGVVAGESVCLLLKEFVPSGAPFNAQNSVTLTASLAYANAVPPLSAVSTRADTTTVGQPGGSGLSITKSVDRATVLPGQTLTYTITYLNQASSPLSSIVIHDTTPPFTQHVSAACGAPLPADLSACTVTSQPAAGGTGAIEWTLTGTLAPGRSGTVSFTLQVAN